VTINEIKELLRAEILSGHNVPTVDIKFAKASDLMSDVLAFSQPCSESDTILLTGLTNKQVVRTCEIAGICAIIFVRGKNPPEETIKLAQDSGIPLLVSKLKMFEACGILFSNGIRGVFS
jgi:serine kinase of HPr protein (carbohydrate metabolism regulator)